MRPLLPRNRWALTPPFHPYSAIRRNGIFSVALSVGSLLPHVMRRLALWSSDFPHPPAGGRDRLPYFRLMKLKIHQSRASHKPNSVKDDHLSGVRLTTNLKQPTRESYEAGSFSSPIWSCSRRGLPCVPCYQEAGGLLPHLFTLVPPDDGTVYFLWHFP